VFVLAVDVLIATGSEFNVANEIVRLKDKADMRGISKILLF
jgi:hypothetical protein